jgi:hypothetical protein
MVAKLRAEEKKYPARFIGSARGFLLSAAKFAADILKFLQNTVDFAFKVGEPIGKSAEVGPARAAARIPTTIRTAWSFAKAVRATAEVAGTAITTIIAIARTGARIVSRPIPWAVRSA